MARRCCCDCITRKLFTEARWVEETETSDVTLETISSKDWLRLTGTVSPASTITHEAYVMEFYLIGELTVDVEGDLFVIDAANGDVSANGNASTFIPTSSGLGAFVQIRVTPTHAHIMVHGGEDGDIVSPTFAKIGAVLTVDRSSAPTGEFTLEAEDPYDEVTRFTDFTLSSSQVIFNEGSSYYDNTPDLECPFSVPELCSHAYQGFVSYDPDTYPGEVFPGLSQGPDSVIAPSDWDDSSVGGGGAFVVDDVGIRIVYVSWDSFTVPFAMSCGMDLDAEDPNHLLSAFRGSCSAFQANIMVFVESTFTPPGSCGMGVQTGGAVNQSHMYVFPEPTAGNPYPKPVVEVTLATNEGSPENSDSASIIAEVPVNDWETANFAISDGLTTWTA